MKFKQGASIFTKDGKEAGRIDRVVIHPQTKLVTHIVVRTGLVFTEDKVVPVEAVAAGQKGRITLLLDADTLEHLPDFQETHYVVLNEEELQRVAVRSLHGTKPVTYWIPPYGQPMFSPYTELPYIAETETHIPADTVAVKEGARVISRDRKHIGNVEQVLTSSMSNRATHFLVSKGLLLKEKKMVPVEWIDKFGENKVRLAVETGVIETLPDYVHA